MVKSLLEKIREGRYELSKHFQTADYYKKRSKKMYEIQMNNQYISDQAQRRMEAEYSSRSERLKSNKHFSMGVEMEVKILKDLRDALEKEFGVDLWDKAMERQRGKGTTEDLYWWYKKQVGQSYTKSELQMRGII